MIAVAESGGEFTNHTKCHQFHHVQLIAAFSPLYQHHLNNCLHR